MPSDFLTCYGDELERQMSNEVALSIASAVVARTLLDVVDKQYRAEAIQFIRYGKTFRAAWTVLTERTRFAEVSHTEIAKRVQGIYGKRERRLFVQRISGALNGITREL